MTSAHAICGCQLQVTGSHTEQLLETVCTLPLGKTGVSTHDCVNAAPLLSVAVAWAGLQLTLLCGVSL